MNRTFYNLLLPALLPLALLRLWWRSRQAPAYRQRIGERLAWGLPAFIPRGVWLHAVSVGETIAAAPLIRALRERYPQLPITVTCMTPTGSERICALFAGQVQHCYLPYDLPWLAARFLDQLAPKLAIIMETELWPNHIHQCAQRGIPTVLANARLSERSARGYGRFSGLIRPMLRELTWIAAQTAVEAERFRQLGVQPERVTVTGSIKFDLSIDPQLPQQARQLREHWSTLARPTWIAASTHAGEDEVLLAAHRQLLAIQPKALLILVPRHPERFAAAEVLCQRAGLATVRRSSGEPVTAVHQVLLGDTMGELLFLYALADCAFVGGSLIAHGGHNFLEPAALGLPLLSGPAVFNFQDIATRLRAAGALAEVTDAESLFRELLALCQNPALRHQRGAAGLAVAAANRGALAKLLAGLEPLLCVSC